MRRAFLEFDGRQVHYRVAGEGAPIVMLHPSPLSSAVLVPMATEFAHHFRVYALDTPGYGLSDGLNAPPQSLDAYLPLLARTLDCLGLGRVCLYGAATGAQIAIEFSKRYPERVALLVADTAGHIDAEECEQILADYFPDVTPRTDGAHLATYWHMARELNVFFPWSVPSARHRIARDLPPLAFMQQFLLDYLRAGTHYDWGYRVAFRNERAARAQEVAVPALLPRWAGSIALRITDALIAAGLPSNFTVLPLGESVAERIQGIAAAVQARYTAAAAPECPDARPPKDGRWRSLLVGTNNRQLHVRMNLAGSGRACVVLHGATESAAVALTRVQPLVGTRPVFGFDLPGFGESDRSASDATSVDECASCIESATRSLGLDSFDILGDGLGACIGAEVARRMPDAVHSVQARPLQWARHPRFTEWLVQFAADLTPRLDGAHLQAAWFFARAQALWSPPFDTSRASIVHGEPQLDTQRLHLITTELLKAGARVAPGLDAEARYPLASVLANLPASVQQP
jgi:pimeloyl-ACP methyl ester carboxylesterase